MLLLRIVLLACAISLTLAAAVSMVGKGDFEYLIFPRGCLDKFLAGDFSDILCLKATISKILGYGIIAGAGVVKVPQIITFLVAGSVQGVSRIATYLDLLGYVIQACYHLVLGTPISAYGETILITIQSLVILAIMWSMDFPGTIHATVVSILIVGTAQLMMSADPSMLAYAQYASIGLFVVSRAWQFITNYNQKSTGKLSFITLFMNFAGSAARIFTTLQEVKRLEVLISFIASTALNFGLVVQYIWYNWINKPAGGRVAGAGKSSKARQSPTSGGAPARVAPAVSGGSSGKGSASESGVSSGTSSGTASPATNAARQRAK